MPHDTHPFAVMFGDGDSYRTMMTFDRRTLAEWLKELSPQLQIVDVVVDWKDCRGRFSSIGELAAFLRPDDYYEQISFL